LNVGHENSQTATALHCTALQLIRVSVRDLYSQFNGHSFDSRNFLHAAVWSVYTIMSAEEQIHNQPSEEEQTVAVEEYTEEEKKLGQDFLDAIVAGNLVSFDLPRTLC
jgi:hypothetical protein